jgi:hypothetical protein
MTDMENPPTSGLPGASAAGPPVPRPAGGDGRPAHDRPGPAGPGIPGPYAPPPAWSGAFPTGPPATAPPPTGAPPARRRRRWLRLLLPLLAVVVIAIVGSAISNECGEDSAPPRAPGTEVAEPTTFSALDLQAGDCYNAAPLAADGSDTRITSVEAVPCADPHNAQVVAKLAYAGQDYTDVVDRRAPEDCTRETEVRLRPELLTDPAYSFGQIHPTAASWLLGPSVACIVVTAAPVTGSALL